LEDLPAQKRIATVLIPEPIIPAINASRKNLVKRFGINDLIKLDIKGKIKYAINPPINPNNQNINTNRNLFII
jgi:hypothetical protein